MTERTTRAEKTQISWLLLLSLLNMHIYITAPLKYYAGISSLSWLYRWTHIWSCSQLICKWNDQKMAIWVIICLFIFTVMVSVSLRFFVRPMRKKFHITAPEEEYVIIAPIAVDPLLFVLKRCHNMIHKYTYSCTLLATIIRVNNHRFIHCI